ncbi:MAG: hypothetical protein K6E50_09060 [Lachnospiraceae bacterium]|nr:hypothetical protein [Lachnospiraceae bacterium]
MKVRRFALVSFLLSLLLIGVAGASLMLPKDYDVVIMLNVCIMAETAGSWLLTLTDLILFLFGKKDLPGKKSYRFMQPVLIGIAVIFGIVSIFTEKGFKGSSAEMILFYLLPMLLIVFLILSIGEGGSMIKEDEIR